MLLSVVLAPAWRSHRNPGRGRDPSVFPPCYSEEQPRNPASTSLAGWSSHASAEEEPEFVSQLLQAQADVGHCLFFDTLDELKLLRLGLHGPRFALLTKLKQGGSAKYTLIWDLLWSEVNSTVALAERTVLPCLEDAVEDGEHLLQIHGAVESLVVEVDHVFHKKPIRPSEGQFMFVVFKVLCMGGKSSPDIWGRLPPATGRVVTFFTFTVAVLALAVVGFPHRLGQSQSRRPRDRCSALSKSLASPWHPMGEAPRPPRLHVPVLVNQGRT